jgi:hypothetical protein
VSDYPAVLPWVARCGCRTLDLAVLEIDPGRKSRATHYRHSAVLIVLEVDVHHSHRLRPDPLLSCIQFIKPPEFYRSEAGFKVF